LPDAPNSLAHTTS